ncbi:MAG: hypothetical protein ACREMN_05265 [Gemmatimonadales bacterium]
MLASAMPFAAIVTAYPQDTLTPAARRVQADVPFLAAGAELRLTAVLGKRGS